MRGDELAHFFQHFIARVFWKCCDEADRSHAINDSGWCCGMDVAERSALQRRDEIGAQKRVLPGARAIARHALFMTVYDFSELRHPITGLFAHVPQQTDSALRFQD